LLIDSLTRVARALREIGLARGEAPTRRGYPASVYPALPALIERSGRTAEGSITAIYTVLVEGTGEADPIAEETRSLTDGHIVLSQEIADSGRYPAIDVLKSLSRVMPSITSELHQYNAQRMRELLAKYSKLQKLRDLRTRLRFAQLVSSKLSETKREKERKEAFAVHDRSKRTAIAIIQGAMDEAKSINDPGARYAAIVKRMGRAHAEAQKAYASVYRDHLKLDALAVRMHSKDLTRKELMEEETTSDILIAFAEGEDI